MATPEIVLQLGPAASVAPDVHAAVTNVFQAAGLDFRFELIPRDRSLTPGAPPAARASLHVFLNSSEPTPPSLLVRQTSDQLGRALARVRDLVPDLPLAVIATSASGRRWFALGPRDTPDAIESAMSCAADEALPEAPVLGWDGASKAWRVL